MKILCLTDVPDGEAFLTIKPEEVIISNHFQSSSSRNHFNGKITDIAPAKLGIEVSVDIGYDMVVIVSFDALSSLGLEIGKEVWIDFKASACKIYN